MGGGRRRLSTMSDLKRYMQSVINRLESGELEASVAGRLGFLVNIQRAIVEQSDFETRLERLERELINK